MTEGAVDNNSQSSANISKASAIGGGADDEAGEDDAGFGFGAKIVFLISFTRYALASCWVV